MNNGQGNPCPSHLGSICPRSGRQLVQDPHGQGGLQNGQMAVPNIAEKIGKVYSSRNRHFYFSWKPPAEKICVETPPVGVRQAGRLDLHIGRYNMLLCKPSMDYHSGVVKSSLGQPPIDVHDDHTLLGWSTWLSLLLKMKCPQIPAFLIPPTTTCFKTA